jgi:streptothricin acetyltransferase
LKMGITIEDLTADNLNSLGKCNSEFVIDSKIIPHYENGKLTYTVAPVPEIKKCYLPEEPKTYRDYLKDADKAGFLAYTDKQLAGQVLLRHNWNLYAWIEDIRVDVNFRRMGAGWALLERAEKWARSKGYPGIMLETQDTNVKACRFYEKYGFIFGGFDTHVYHAARLYADEIALFWYLDFGNIQIVR